MTGTWVEFIAAIVVFLVSHRIPTIPKVKEAVQSRFGPKSFTIAYSLLSTFLLVWLIVAAGNAPFVPLWDQSLWQRWLVNLAMPIALGLVVFGVAVPNPLSFGGLKSGFDPEHPGIAGVVRHPLLWALALWSGAHLIANGDMAHVILFGIFLVFSILGMWMIDRRMQRQMGMSAWRSLARSTSTLPFAALLQSRWHPQTGPGLLRFAVCALVWGAIFLLHIPVIGVNPSP